MKRIAFAALAAALTAACMPANDVSSAGTAAAEGRVLRLSGNGLETAQQGLHSADFISFGSPQQEVIARVAAVRGRPAATGRNEDCPEGPVDYASWGPLDLHFRGGRFVGWVLDGPANPPIEEEYGLGIGTTRADLAESDQGPATFEISTLGHEFDYNGIGGLLSGDGANARVRTLFAGATCFAR